MRFEIHGLIGKGGCGAVYQAFDRATASNVALKILTDTSPNARARFAREARSASRIHHPNVCGLYDAGALEDGRPFVAMELLVGKTLRTALHESGAFEVEDAIEIAVQMLTGLEVAHSHGLIHRDVKPENVFLARNEHGGLQVKLLDFGLCRSAADPFDGKTLTALGSVVGTPGYLAPEQLATANPVDARVDIFTSGLVLFEMLTGRPAYRGKNVVQLVASLLAHEVPSTREVFPDLPPAIDEVVLRATERQPARRYATAGRFLHDLLEARTRIRRERRAA